MCALLGCLLKLWCHRAVDFICIAQVVAAKTPNWVQQRSCGMRPFLPSHASRCCLGSWPSGTPGSLHKLTLYPLCAANCLRMQVTLKATTLQRRSGNGSTTAASYTPGSVHSDSAAPPAPASAAAAAGADASAAGDDGEGSATPRGAVSVSGGSVRSGEWPTAASMMWDDLMVSVVAALHCGNGQSAQQ
jgi:hypothetical protein